MATLMNDVPTVGLSIRFVRICHRVYKVTLSPWIGRDCRFHPTCSDYALEAVEKHGFLRGLFLAVGRVARCHPYCSGGIDPVPEQKHPRG